MVQDRERSKTGLSAVLSLSVCLLNQYAEHVVRNAGLDELQTGIKLGGRNINNLIFVDDITLTAESEEELKSHLMRVKEESETASVQFSSVAQSCLTLCDPLNCSTPGLPVHHQLPEFTKLMCMESVMPSNHLILCCPFLLLLSIFPSIRVFSNESALCISRPKC